MIIGWGMHYCIDLLFWLAVLFTISYINGKCKSLSTITLYMMSVYKLEVQAVINPPLSTKLQLTYEAAADCQGHLSNFSSVS